MGANSSRQQEINTTVWNLPGQETTVILRHGEVSGLREVTVNGKVVLTETRKFDNGSKHEVKVGDKTINVIIIPSWLSFSYRLDCGGKEVS